MSGFLNFYNQKYTFESVLFVAEKLKHYIQFTPQQLNELEQEFRLLQSITLNDLPNDVLEKAAIRNDTDGNNMVLYFQIIRLAPIKVSLIISSNLLRLYCASSIATREKNLYSQELEKI